MVEVGDEGIVMSSFGEKFFVPLGDLEVGDEVVVYNLKGGDRIAVPVLTLAVGDWVFKTPAFDFSGFNWALNFNFELLPLAAFLFDRIHPVGISRGNWGPFFAGDKTHWGKIVYEGYIYYAFFPDPQMPDMKLFFFEDNVMEIYICYSNTYDLATGDSVLYWMEEPIANSPPGDYGPGTKCKYTATVNWVTGEVLDVAYPL